MENASSSRYRLLAFTTAEKKRVFIPLHAFVSLTDDPDNEGVWTISYLYGDKLLYNLLDEAGARAVFDRLVSPEENSPRFER